MGRVIFKFKDGSEKNMEKPLAQRLQKRNKGKVIKEILSNKESFKKMSKDIEVMESEIVKLNENLNSYEEKEKALIQKIAELEKQNGKPENRKTK